MTPDDYSPEAMARRRLEKADTMREAADLLASEPEAAAVFRRWAEDVENRRDDHELPARLGAAQMTIRTLGGGAS